MPHSAPNADQKHGHKIHQMEFVIVQILYICTIIKVRLSNHIVSILNVLIFIPTVSNVVLHLNHLNQSVEHVTLLNLWSHPLR